MDVLPLLPTHRYVLDHGRDLPEGAQVRRHKVRQGDGTMEWDGTYDHESSRGVVHSLVVAIKRQGVWDVDAAFAEMMKPEKRGSRWLREQDDPRATFAELWASAYDLDPKLSFEQMVTVLVSAIEETPGIQRVYLLDLAARHGWRNRGHVDSLLAGLVADGSLREERTYGPSGTQVTSRRFWRRVLTPVATLAKTTTSTLFLTLLAVGATSSGKGLRTPGRERSYLRLLTDKKLRAVGRKLHRQRLGRLRRPWRPAPPPPPLTNELRDQILDGLDPTLLTYETLTPSLMTTGVTPVPMGKASWSLDCLL